LQLTILPVTTVSPVKLLIFDLQFDIIKVVGEAEAGGQRLVKRLCLKQNTILFRCGIGGLGLSGRAEISMVSPRH